MQEIEWYQQCQNTIFLIIRAAQLPYTSRALNGLMLQHGAGTGGKNSSIESRIGLSYWVLEYPRGSIPDRMSFYAIENYVFIFIMFKVKYYTSGICDLVHGIPLDNCSYINTPVCCLQHGYE